MSDPNTVESDHLVQIDVDDQGSPIWGVPTVCDGSSSCPGPHHYHGCFADLDGSACDDPADHAPAGHNHCNGGACESCDCCAAGWCVNFEDGDPWADSLAFFEHITPTPEPGSGTWQRHREAFDLWCEIACESRGFAVRTTSAGGDA